MKSAFYNALLLAIFFTVLPGRIMHDVVFGVSTADASQQAVPLWAWILIGVALVSGGRYVLTRSNGKLLWIRLSRSDKDSGATNRQSHGC
ncbi:hypothetical protein [Allopusillimonas ginsengisoli]|uniref:hypothetical protein n=1 Tax=Allopusillimonas ginsengisoli TaxID=453575 RepID=UPI00101FA670|nr:hypothetical protein [Allopusillimonas ginsengisoli]TEA78138.1 hypothetical protein ERE07_12135 [Allopusillimonas ginsengisoli]